MILLPLLLLRSLVLVVCGNSQKSIEFTFVRRNSNVMATYVSGIMASIRNWTECVWTLSHLKLPAIAIVQVWNLLKLNSNCIQTTVIKYIMTDTCTNADRARETEREKERDSCLPCDIVNHIHKYVCVCVIRIAAAVAVGKSCYWPNVVQFHSLQCVVDSATVSNSQFTLHVLYNVHTNSNFHCRSICI